MPKEKEENKSYSMFFDIKGTKKSREFSKNLNALLERRGGVNVGCNYYVPLKNSPSQTIITNIYHFKGFTIVSTYNGKRSMKLRVTLYGENIKNIEELIKNLTSFPRSLYPK